jgi:hypothetical protein
MNDVETRNSEREFFHQKVRVQIMKTFFYQAMIMTTAACLLVLGTSTASAYSSGIDRGGTSCGGCHGGSPSSSVITMISGPSSLLQLETATYTASITPTLVGAGFDIFATAGSLTATDLGTGLDNGEVVHTQRNDGVFSYNFDVTAPAALGTFDLLGVMLAYNKDFDNSSADLWNTTTFQISVISDPIPEPGTLALAGLGMIGICAGFLKRRRR